MEFLNDVWMNIYNPNDFFQTIIFMLLIVAMYLITIPTKKALKKIMEVN